MMLCGLFISEFFDFCILYIGGYEELQSIPVHKDCDSYLQSRKTQFARKTDFPVLKFLLSVHIFYVVFLSV